MRRAFWRKPERRSEIIIEGDIKVVNDKPPIYDDVCGAFSIRASAYFTYGDTIYTVNVPYPPPDIIVHERVHMEQQKEMTPELWWGKFLRDPEFRIDQEARAYGEQYKLLYESTTNRDLRVRHLWAMANVLSGPMYNKATTHENAMKLIKKYAGVK